MTFILRYTNVLIIIMMMIIIIGRPFVLSFCPVCNVGVLWPSAWTDQDKTWHTGRPRPRPHCVIWGPSSPSQKGYSTPVFGPCLLWPNGRPFQLLLSSCYYYYRCIAFLPCLFGFFIKRTGRSGERSERIATKNAQERAFCGYKA